MKKFIKKTYVLSGVYFLIGIILALCIVLLISTDNKQKQLNLANKIVSANPNDSTAWAMLGACYYQHKKYDNAIEAYKQALKIDDKCVAAYMGMGLYYADIKKDYNEALKWIKASMIVDHKKRSSNAY